MEFSYVIAAARRFGWVVLLGLVAGTAVGYYASLSGTATFQATASLIVQPAADGPLRAQMGNRYVENEAIVVTSGVNAARVADRLGEPVDQVRRGVRAEARPQTDAIDITATRTDASRAIELANAFAEEYVAARIDRNNELIDAELATLESKAEELLSRIGELNAELADFPAELSRAEQTLFNQKLQEATLLSADLSADVASERELENARSAIRDRVVEPAVVANKIAGASSILLPAGSIAGAVLGVIAAIFLGAASGSVVDTLQAEQVLGARVLGVMPRRRLFRKLPDVLSRRGEPVPLIDEICVRTETAPRSTPVFTVAVVGTQIGAGSTTLAAAIASQSAYRGHPTLLADGDMRDPQVSRELVPKSNTGLGELMRSPDQVVRERDLYFIRPNLEAIGVGSSELRAPARMMGDPDFESLGAFGHEVVVIDCGALLRSASSVSLARGADLVVVVSPLRHEKVGNLSSIRGVLDSMSALVVGVANSPRRRWWFGWFAEATKPGGVALQPESVQTPVPPRAWADPERQSGSAEQTRDEAAVDDPAPGSTPQTVASRWSRDR